MIINNMFPIYAFPIAYPQAGETSRNKHIPYLVQMIRIRKISFNNSINLFGREPYFDLTFTRLTPKSGSL